VKFLYSFVIDAIVVMPRDHMLPVMMLCVCEGESNAAVEVWSGYRVRASVLPAVCRRCSLADCLSRCYADGSCYGVDYDAAAAAGANSTCYALNSTLTCASLTPAGSQFIHVSTAHCGQPLTHSLTHSRHGTGSLGHRVSGSFGSSFTSGSPGHHFDPV